MDNQINYYCQEYKHYTCRVCLEYIAAEPEVIISVFDPLNNTPICDKINEIVHINIYEGDGLPDKICNSCVQSLVTAYEFKQKCKHSDDILRIKVSAGKSLPDVPIDVKDKLLNSDEQICLKEHQNNGIKDEEHSEVEDNEQECSQLQPSEQLTAHTSLLEEHSEVEDDEQECSQLQPSEQQTAHTSLLEDPIQVKEEIFDNVCDEHNSSGEQQENIKYEDEHNEISDEALGCDELQFTEEQPKLKSQSFKSRAIDLHLECDDCGQFFRSKCKLRVHWKKEHMRSQLTCPRCKKVCSSYKNFHTHMKKQSKLCLLGSKIKIEGEGKSRTFHCTQCEFKAKKMYLMEIHLRVHTGECPYSCNICNKFFSQLTSLIRHKEGVHKMKSKERICKLCGKHLNGQSQYYTHMRSHTTSYPCEECGKVLKSKHALKDHTLRHSGTKTFTCEICAKMFVSSAELANHKAKIHLKSRIYKCNKCAFSAQSHNSITLHKKRHTGTNIPCTVCGKFVDNEVQLKLHQEKHVKNFNCEYCGKSYYLKQYLHKHYKRCSKY